MTLTSVPIYENIQAVLRLRAIRERKGVSLRALKRVSGVAVATLARLEAGQGDPQLSTLKKLAKALNVSVAQLIGEAPFKKGGRYGAHKKGQVSQ